MTDKEIRAKDFYDYRMSVIYNERGKDGRIVDTHVESHYFKFPLALVNDMEMRLECTDKRVNVFGGIIKYMKARKNDGEENI